MNNYYNSSPRRYKRTMSKQFIKDIWESDWFIWVLVVLLIGLTYWLAINYLDNAIQSVDGVVEKVQR